MTVPTLDPTSANYASRMGQLAQTHPWMDPQMSASLAAAPTSDDQMNYHAGLLKQAIGAVWSGYHSVIDDPVLHKQDSFGLALHRYVTSALGPVPVADNDLQHIQTQLQAHGYASGLSADGSWSSDWNSAYHDYVDAQYSKQIAGDKPGSVSTGGFFHAVLSAITPAHVVDNLVGYAKALPGDVRSAVADLAGDVSTLQTLPFTMEGQFLAHGIHASPREALINSFKIGGSIGGHIRTILGQQTNTDQQVQQMISGRQGLTDVGTVFTVTSLGAGGVAKAAALTTAKDVAATEAAQSGGVIANSLGRNAAAGIRQTGLLAKTFGGGLTRDELAAADEKLATEGMTAAERRAALQGVREAMRRGLLQRRLFVNAPGMSQLAPWVGRLADGDGSYYRLRTFLATPYTYTPIAVAGKAFQQGQLASLGVEGLANVEGSQSNLSQQIAGTHTGELIFDPVDAAVRRATGTATGGHLHLSLSDFIMATAHGPLGGPGSVRANITDAADEFAQHAGMTNGTAGVHGMFEVATSNSPDGIGAFVKGLGKGSTGFHSLDDMIGEADGNVAMLDKWMKDKVNGLAAYHYVAKELNAEGMRYGMEGYDDRAAQLMDTVYGDQASLAAARTEFLQNPLEAAMRIRSDLVRNGLKAKTLLHTIKAQEEPLEDGATVADGAVTHDLGNYFKASERLSGAIRDHGLLRVVMGGEGQGLYRDALDPYDFGGDLPEGSTFTRVTTLNRRQYVRDVGQLSGNVERAIARNRQKVAADIAAAQKDQNDALDARTGIDRQNDAQAWEANKAQLRSAGQRLRQAKARGDRLEETINSTDFRPILKMLSDTNRSDAYLSDEFSKTSSDFDKLRHLVKQGMDPEEKATVRSVLEHAQNPDDLYTRVNGPVRNRPPEIGGSGWLADQLALPGGSIGLASIDTLLQQEGTTLANNLEAKYQAALAKGDQHAADLVIEEAKDEAFRHFDISTRSLGVFDNNNPEKIFDLMRDRASKLASEVFTLPHAVSEEDKWMVEKHQALVADLAAMGYKLAVGSHIGHLFSDDLADMGALGGRLNTGRRFLHWAGAETTAVNNQTSGLASRNAVLSKFGKVWLDNPGEMPVRSVPADGLQLIHEAHEPKLKHLDNLAFGLARAATGGKAHKLGIEQLAHERGILTERGTIDWPKAQAEYQQDMIRRGIQQRDIPRKELVKLWMTPTTFNNGAEWSGVSREVANQMYRALQEGYANRPRAIMGLQAMEDWGRAGFGFLGRVAYRHPGNNLLQQIANTGNRYVQIRNRWRFAMSPMFDLRRIVKTNTKMGLSGVEWSWAPLSRMVENGSYDDASAFYRKVVDQHEDATAWDEAARYLNAQSSWGLYNGRMYEMHFAWQKHLEGLTDQEVRDAVHYTFDYGGPRGRAALERSMNTVWFPFSFEKTLLRNTGGYLLDHPGQALILANAINGYSQANEMEGPHNWLRNHLPIVGLIDKVNAFSHGISPGEFGGVNVPMMKMFLPMVINGRTALSGKGLVSNLQTVVPAIKDFGDVFHAGYDQAYVARNALDNGYHWATSLGAPRKPFDPYLPMETPEAQRIDGASKKAQIVSNLQTIVDYNDSHTNKYTFPVDEPGQPGTGIPVGLQGKPIDKTTIGDLVKVWYPAYDPTFGRKYAIQQEADLQKELASIPDPTKRDEYSQFASIANTYIGYLNSDKYTTAQASQTYQAFHQFAVTLSEKDPEFYKLWNAHFAWAFGPLEAVTNG